MNKLIRDAIELLESRTPAPPPEPPGPIARVLSRAGKLIDAAAERLIARAYGPARVRDTDYIVSGSGRDPSEMTWHSEDFEARDNEPHEYSGDGNRFPSPELPQLPDLPTTKTPEQIITSAFRKR